MESAGFRKFFFLTKSIKKFQNPGKQTLKIRGNHLQLGIQFGMVGLRKSRAAVMQAGRQARNFVVTVKGVQIGESNDSVGVYLYWKLFQ